jgi:hypothetical protein
MNLNKTQTNEVTWRIFAHHRRISVETNNERCAFLNQSVLCYLQSTEEVTWKLKHSARHQWLTPAIVAIWEAEVGKIAVHGQPGQIVHETPSPK